MTDDQMPARHDRSEVSAEPMTLRELADVTERVMQTLVTAVRDAAGNGPSGHAGGPGGVGEGTEWGEAPGGAEGLATGGVIPADAGAVLAQIGERGCDLRVDLSSLSSVARVMAGIEPVIMLQKAEYAALVAERDGLRGKVEAVRALHPPVFTQMYDGTIRAQCDYCIRLCHSGSGLHCDEPYDAPWPCETIAALDGGEG